MPKYNVAPLCAIRKCANWMQLSVKHGKFLVVLNINNYEQLNLYSGLGIWICIWMRMWMAYEHSLAYADRRLTQIPIRLTQLARPSDWCCNFKFHAPHQSANQIVTCPPPMTPSATRSSTPPPPLRSDRTHCCAPPSGLQ